MKTKLFGVASLICLMVLFTSPVMGIPETANAADS